MECGKAAFPSLAKAELSKLRFKQMLEHRRDVGAQGFNGPLSVVCMVIVEEGIVPSFAKEGWTRPKENAAKHPLRSGRGSCFKLPVIIPNGLSNRWLETATPSAPNKEWERFS